MRERSATFAGVFSIFFMMFFAGIRAGAQSAAPSPAVHMVVSVEARHNGDVPDVTQQDVVVTQGHDRRKVTGWIPATGEHAGLELYILVDDSSGFSLGTQLNDVRAFIMGQPSSTYIAIAYMHNGASQVVQPLTADHSAAAAAVRLPFGNSAGQASPYFSVDDLLKHWPMNPARPRHEILMITNGIDLYGPGAQDPYLDDAIQKAQQAGTIVYSIYTPGGGHFGHSFWRMNGGQNDLSQFSDQVGGEAYNLGVVSAESYKPFLDDVSARLGHQYLLTFLAKPEKKAGMQSVKLSTEVPNAELVSADHVFVPGAGE